MADPFSSFSGWSRPGRQLILLPISPGNTEKAYHAGYEVPSAQPKRVRRKLSLFLPSRTRSHRSQGGRVEVTNAAKQRCPNRLGRTPQVGSSGFYKTADHQPDRVGQKCGKWLPPRRRASRTRPAPFEAWLFIRMVASDVHPKLKAAPLYSRTVRLSTGPGIFVRCQDVAA